MSVTAGQTLAHFVCQILGCQILWLDTRGANGFLLELDRHLELLRLDFQGVFIRGVINVRYRETAKMAVVLCSMRRRDFRDQSIGREDRSHSTETAAAAAHDQSYVQRWINGRVSSRDGMVCAAGDS